MKRRVTRESFTSFIRPPSSLSHLLHPFTLPSTSLLTRLSLPRATVTGGDSEIRPEGERRERDVEGGRKGKDGEER